MKKYSINDKISRKKIKGILGYFRIPKEFRDKIIDLMIEDNFLENINRDSIKILKQDNEEIYKKSFDQVIWTNLLEEIKQLEGKEKK